MTDQEFEQAPIGTIARVTLGKMVKSNPSKKETVSLPYLHAANVRDFGILDVEHSHRTMWFSPSEVEHLRIEAGDVVVVEGGAVGKSAYIKADLEGYGFQNSILRIRADEQRSNGRFIQHCLQAAFDSGTIARECSSVSLAHFPAEKVGRFRIPLPPLETQQRIADYLDVETGQIDTTVSTLDELIEEMKSRRVQVIIKKLEEVGNAATFSSGEKEGDPGTSGERDSTALSVHLGLLADFISGVGFPVSEQGLADEEIPFHKVASLKNECLNESTNTVSKETAKKLRARIIPEDSVLMAKVGEAMRLNRFSMNATKCCIDNNMLAIVPQRELLNSEYLRYVLSMFNIQVFINPGPVPSLDVQGLRMFSIALLPLEKQKAVVSFLDSETSRIDKIISTATELRSELLARRSALITEVVTGQRQV